ncbi:MAG: cbb3-type cytochrome c oxidase subunit I [Planctomycetes bacterium]|nr:cbb3-type cytochrome c oxidase subunit I [Planctomycetota bacterium]
MERAHAARVAHERSGTAVSESASKARWFSTDHEHIGRQYLFTSLAMLVLGGMMALAIRWQLAWPWTEMPLIGRVLFPKTGHVISPDFYTVLFTMHGTIMIFFVIIPLLVGAFGNLLVPAMIGAREMAFPRLNMWSYWTMIPAIACLLAGFFVEGGGAASGWTGYAPLASVTSGAQGSGTGQTLWLVALLMSGVSSLLGAITYVTTIATHRARGMTLMRMPLTVWGVFTASALQVVALPMLTAGGLLQLADRLLLTGFFTPQNLVINGVALDAVAATGGSPLLWQHLFWFYSHPAVYVMVLPAMGIVSDVLSVHGRKPVFGYKPMVWALCAICVLGFLVWGHHMFVSGMSPAAGTAFMLSTFVIALPSSIKTFNWLATLHRARIQLTASMLFALGFVALFIIGGLSGLWMAATPVDVYINNTYVVVAHFHFIVFGGSVFAVFAGLYHWYPRFFGRALDERLGKLHFVGTFVLTNCVFLMMHQLGLAGMLRRTADPYVYGMFEHLRPVNVFITWSAIALAAWQLVFVVNLLKARATPRREHGNPWRACSLEWRTAASAPIVEHGPYEYSRPDANSDWLPQARDDTPERVSSRPQS